MAHLTESIIESTALSWLAAFGYQTLTAKCG